MNNLSAVVAVVWVEYGVLEAVYVFGTVAQWICCGIHVPCTLYSMKQIREQVKKEDVDVKTKSSHHSQTDAAKGFGGKYGVMKERQDKVQ